MPVFVEAKNGVWYKKPTEEEIERKQLVDDAVAHAHSNKLPHSVADIGAGELLSSLSSIGEEIGSIRSHVATNADQISVVQEANSRLLHLEKKLWYQGWFFKNASFDYLEFETFHDDSNLFHGIVEDGKLVPDPAVDPGQYSIYKTVKFVPKMTKAMSRYMIHVEYNTDEGGGLIVEVSFDSGQSFHKMLSTVPEPNTAYYYHYPDFCDTVNNVPELDADSFILRFRLLSNDSGSGVYVSSYGIMLA